MCRYLTTNDLVYDRMKQFVQQLPKTTKNGRKESACVCLCVWERERDAQWGYDIQWDLNSELLIVHYSNSSDGASLKSCDNYWPEPDSVYLHADN